MKKTTKKLPRKSEGQDKPTLVVFLLDRSGSMGTCIDETIGGFNGYLDELKKDADPTMRFTMAQFDSVGFDSMCSFAKLEDVKRLDKNSFKPRGGTPLFDAIGMAIEQAQAQAGKKHKVMFVTLTDGQENSSSKFDLDGIRGLISKKEKADHWTFAYIGMGVDGFKAAQHLSQGTVSASNIMPTNKAGMIRGYATFASKTKEYSKSRRAGGQSVNCMWSATIK